MGSFTIPALFIPVSDPLFHLQHYVPPCWLGPWNIVVEPYQAAVNLGTNILVIASLLVKLHRPEIWSRVCVVKCHVYWLCYINNEN